MNIKTNNDHKKTYEIWICKRQHFIIYKWNVRFTIWLWYLMLAKRKEVGWKRETTECLSGIPTFKNFNWPIGNKTDSTHSWYRVASYDNYRESWGKKVISFTDVFIFWLIVITYPGQRLPLIYVQLIYYPGSVGFIKLMTNVPEKKNAFEI